MHTLYTYLIDSFLVSGLIVGAVCTLVVGAVVLARMAIGVRNFINRNNTF